MQVDLLMTAIILIIITRRSQKSKRKKHALISFARVFCYTLNSEVLEGLGPPLIPKKNTMWPPSKDRKNDLLFKLSNSVLEAQSKQRINQ